MSDAFTKRTMQAVLGLTVTYTLYPAIGAGVVAGTVVTSGAGAWGADKELIAALAIASESWICACDLDTADAAQPYVVDIEEAGATHLWSFRCDLTAVTVNISRVLVGPFPKYVNAGVQVTARASGTAAKVLGCSVTIATGL